MRSSGDWLPRPLDALGPASEGKAAEEGLATRARLLLSDAGCGLGASAADPAMAEWVRLLATVAFAFATASETVASR